MNNYKQLTSKSLEELARWLDINGKFDDSPWEKWFNEKYCSNCASVICTCVDAKEKLGIKPFYKRSIECAYCELENKCKFFPDMEEIPDNRDIIEMWLKEKTGV